MKIAITGGTGFVGRHLAVALAGEGHEAVLIARGVDHRDESIRHLPRGQFFPIGTDDVGKLTAAFKGCEGVAHCAGINREMGAQTYDRVHIEGTRHVIEAARRARVRKIALLSFLRARPDCGSGYHQSKWAAEEIVRNSGLEYTILKSGVIYGRGDHMLDHLSHAFHSFPVFGLVGMNDQFVRPVAVEDVVRILKASLVDGCLPRHTISVLGPEQITLREAVCRVSNVVGKKPWMFRMPLVFHYAFGWLLERIMTIPLVSIAQVEILSEGVVDPWGPCQPPPEDIAPTTAFTDAQIRRGLPEPKRFGWEDLILCQQSPVHR
jgi:NADH dehydrogenase